MFASCLFKVGPSFDVVKVLRIAASKNAKKEKKRTCVQERMKCQETRVVRKSLSFPMNAWYRRAEEFESVGPISYR